MSKKILFLDFDDVLNTAETLARGELFEMANIDVLNAVVDRTDTAIVVTSMWRLGATLDELEDLLIDAGVHASGRVIGSTPCLADGPRGAEISAWLHQSSMPTSRFAILDNLDMGELNNYLIQTDPQCGLVRNQVEAIVSLLNGQAVQDSACQIGGTCGPLS